MKANNEFQQVFFIGPQYKNYQGGIGAVLATYARQIKNFKFISSYDAHYKLPRNIIYFVGTFFRIFWRLITDRSIKIVHLHGAARGSFYRMFFIFILTKYIFRKKIIYHLHASEFKEFYKESSYWVKKSVQHLMEKSDVIICLSHYWYQYLNTHFTIKKLCILNNPIHPPSNGIQRKIKKNAKLNLLFLGIIGKRKGVFDLLKVLSENQAFFKEKLTLTIGGNGETSKLKNFIRKNSLEDWIHFEGWVNDERKHQLLSNSDVLILPSYNEGLPIAILEAMSYGLAIIASNVGGIPEIVKNDENGFLIEPGNIQQIEDSLKKLIKTPSVIPVMGESSKSKVKNHFTSNVLTRLGEIYCEVLKHESTPIPLSNRIRIKLLDIYRKANQLDLYKEYLRNQFRYSKKDIENYQEKRFREIFEFHYSNNPTYKDFVESRGFDKTAPFDIQSIPTLSKDFFRQNQDSYPIQNEIAKTKHSSGSTGTPLTYHLNRSSLKSQWPDFWRALDMYNIFPCDKTLMIAGHALFSNRSFKRRIYDRINNFWVVPAFDLTEEALEKAYQDVCKKNIKVIYAYTSGVLLFLQFLKKQDYHLNLKAIFTTAELFIPSVRPLAKEFCNCDVIDTYGANDGGVQAFECPHHTGYHINFEKCMVEIIDGEIVLTDLLNTASPFIRYRVGDCTSGQEIIKDRCECGRSLFRIPDITGRINNYIKDIDSNIVHTAFFNQLFASDLHVLQFQVIQKKEKLYINIVHDGVLKNQSYLAKYYPLIRKRIKMSSEIIFNQPIYKLPNLKVPVFWKEGVDIH